MVRLAVALLLLSGLPGGCGSPTPAAPELPVAQDADAPTAEAEAAPEDPAPKPSVVHFERFGPAPGTTEEQFRAWGELVSERYLGDPAPERIEELDGLIAEFPPVLSTPVFINALHGLDMGEADDVVRAHAISMCWYEGQAKYKHVVLDGKPGNVLPVHIGNRMLVIDSWVRFWNRTLETPEGVETYRKRVAQLWEDLNRLRAERRGGNTP